MFQPRLYGFVDTLDGFQFSNFFPREVSETFRAHGAEIFEIFWAHCTTRWSDSVLNLSLVRRVEVNLIFGHSDEILLRRPLEFLRLKDFLSRYIINR